MPAPAQTAATNPWSVNVGLILHVMAEKVNKIVSFIYFILSYFSDNVDDSSYVHTCDSIQSPQPNGV